MEDLNYYLIEASEARLKGWGVIDFNFAVKCIRLIYGGNSYANALVNKMVKFRDITYSKYKRVDAISISVVIQNKNFIYNSNKLATSKISGVVNYIYHKALLDDAYADLAFVLLILGIVNSEDYVENLKSVDELVSRFNVSKNRVSVWDTSIDDLVLSYRNYVELMSLFVVASSKGVNYGYSVYSFIYNMLTYGEKIVSRKKTSINLDKVVNVLGGLKLSSIDCFKVEDLETRRKYAEEIIISIPMLLNNGLAADIARSLIMELYPFCREAIINYTLENKTFIWVVELGKDLV